MTIEQHSNKHRSDVYPDNPTTDDLLGFEHFAKSISRRIVKTETKNTPLTIGIFGDWGSGKTSFLMMVEQLLKKQDINPIWFNAWKYSHENNLWSALIQTILHQAQVSGKWHQRLLIKFKIWFGTFDFRKGSWEIGKLFLSFGIRGILIIIGLFLLLSWSSETAYLFKVLTPPNPESAAPSPHLFIDAAIKIVGVLITVFAIGPEKIYKLFSVKLGIDFSKFKKSESYRSHIAFLDEFNDKFKKIIKLAGKGKPLTIIIDDLDRCFPDKSIQVLEAIKLFLDVEGCIFLLAVDQNIVEKAIAIEYKEFQTSVPDSQTDSTSQSSHFGENYFEKMIQLPFQLPPISDNKFKEFVTEVYRDDDIKQCVDIFTEGLARNPRKIKRVLNTFIILRDFAEEDSVPSLIAKIVVIQSLFRSVYSDLSRFPTLLAELEQLYDYQSNPDGAEHPRGGTSDPVLREKVDTVAIQYPLLRKILLKKVHADDTFIKVDLVPYLSLTKSTVEPVPIDQISDSYPSEATGQYLRMLINLSRTESSRYSDFTDMRGSKADLPDLALIIPSFNDLSGDGKDIQITELLKKYLRLVILGPPGSGKTTLLLTLANIFSRAFAQDDLSIIEKNFGIKPIPLPIFISLRDYGFYLQREDKRTASPISFFSFLDDYFRKRNIGLPENYFIPYFERGTCILLLDGLDEVPTEVKQDVIRTIAALSARYPMARTIVTARIATYYPGLGEDFTRYEISEFGEKDVRRFVEQWASAHSKSARDTKRQAERVLSTIFENEGLRALAGNPLLLTMMLRYYKSTGDLPKYRTAFYEGLITLLSDEWESAKGLDDARKLLDLNRHDIRSFLAKLAFQVYADHLISFDESLAISSFKQGFIDKGFSVLEADGMAFSLLTKLVERSGIIVRVTSTNEYRFMHLTIQEYLASIDLLGQMNYKDLVLRLHKDPLWREVIVFSILRADQNAREDIMDALVRSKSAAGPLIVSRVLLETPDLRDAGIVKRAVESLSKIIVNKSTAETDRVEAQKMLDQLEQERKVTV